MNTEFDSDEKLFSYQKNFVEYVCNNHTDKRKYMLMFEAGTGKTYAYIKTVERLIRRGVYERAEIVTRAVLHSSIRNHIPPDMTERFTISSFKTFCYKYLTEKQSMDENLQNYYESVKNRPQADMLYQKYAEDYVFKYGSNNTIYIFDEIQVVLGEGAYYNDTKSNDEETFATIISDLYTNYVNKPTSNIITIFSTATLMINRADPICKFAKIFGMFCDGDNQSSHEKASQRVVENCEIFIYNNGDGAIKDHYIEHPYFKSEEFRNTYILPTSKYRQESISTDSANNFQRKFFEAVVPLYSYDPSKQAAERSQLRSWLTSTLTNRNTIPKIQQLTVFCNVLGVFGVGIAFILYNEIKAYLKKEPGYAVAYYENHLEKGAYQLIEAFELLNEFTTIRTSVIELKKNGKEETDDQEVQQFNVAMGESKQFEQATLSGESYKYCLVESGNAGYFSKNILPNANSASNVMGKYCNLVMFSTVFREGVSFSNVLRKYYPVYSWNLTSKYQVEYRTLRSNSFVNFDLSTMPSKYLTESGKIYPHNFTMCFAKNNWDFRKVSFVSMIEGPFPATPFENLELYNDIMKTANEKHEGINQVNAYLLKHNNKNFLGKEVSGPREFLSYNMFDAVRGAIKSDFNMCLLSDRITKGIVSLDVPLSTAVMNREFVVMPLTKLGENYSATTAPITISKGNIITYRSITKL